MADLLRRDVHMAFHIGWLPWATAVPDVVLDIPDGVEPPLALILTGADGHRHVLCMSPEDQQAIVEELNKARAAGEGLAVVEKPKLIVPGT